MTLAIATAKVQGAMLNDRLRAYHPPPEKPPSIPSENKKNRGTRKRQLKK